jgi:hypothetical protein
VHDPEHAGGDEAGERGYRERYVDVEDLLDEALVDVVRGVEEDERERCRDRRRGGDRKPPEAASE